MITQLALQASGVIAFYPGATLLLFVAGFLWGYPAIMWPAVAIGVAWLAYRKVSSRALRQWQDSDKVVDLVS